ncbi:tRNA (cytidine32/uridine32-2'-O)-methyltransferase [Acinetobacter calcoaceticus]|uniref:tRNA (cytidine/uridine-2'-O-)-methyltransferase TrmJ n=1 Tax=Acinetobacter calcoaceticus TaxID=471 RepID=A0A4R1XR64_ACICA|nr:tRNA (cytidine32/uridine32-2'-O)-methyltransferase [Acinetobacter calcoaceticus]
MNLMDNDAISSHLSQVRIVMVNTTLPANIGSALRAMKTMGLSKLVLVAPKTYPHPDIDALAAGATDLIDQIEIVDTLEQAIADCQVVFGTSARSRTIPWPLLDARPAAEQTMQAVVHKQQKVAIMFGREDRGLTNDELALANYHVTIPVNSDYGVLNVAQAIQIISYEMRMATLSTLQQQQAMADEHKAAANAAENVVDQTIDHAVGNTVNRVEPALMPVTDQVSMQWDEPLVDHAQMQQFYPHMEKMLADIEFLDPENPRLLPLRLRRLFGRIQLDRMEYHLLRGVFTRVQAMSHGTWKKSNPQENQR